MSSSSSSSSFNGGKFSHISLDDIKYATDNFNNRNVLGKGGEATVYLAKLKPGPHLGITKVAVKHMKPNCQEFDQEIKIVSKIRHPNLVSLLGYCNESGQKILIYEYMENGSLSNYVKKNSKICLSWLQRVRICLDAARGLQHLHAETDEFPKGVIHRDVKPENILLGKDWIAKISDFGMFKVSDVGQVKSTMNTNLKGTGGYYAPEYIAYRHVTRKIDVYALGVVLFQVLCLKMPWDRGDESYYSTDDEDLGIWAQQNVDPKIELEISDGSLKKFTSIVGKSLKKDPKKRPNIDSVVLGLEKVMSLQEIKRGGDEAANTAGFFKRFTSIIGKSLRKDPSKRHPTTATSASTDAVVVGREKGDDGEGKQDLAARQQDNPSRSALHLFTRRYAFDLEDLLRGDAEVLGKGEFGTSYKNIMEDGTTVVVKRLREVSAGKQEFEELMEMVGSIKHENVVELIAYSRDEKLILCDYYSLGSLHSMLHGFRGEGRGPLSWESRVRIAIGASRGVARIHEENGGKLVHGNIKSSNIFLNPQQYGCISDIGLPSIITPHVYFSSGYKAPEIIDPRKGTQRSDVYSFGVVLLELLTGKSLVPTLPSDEVINLVSWVLSVSKEEEVFDLELLRYSNNEEELVKMFQIAMSCVTSVPDQRPKMHQVVTLLETVTHLNPEIPLHSIP